MICRRFLNLVMMDMREGGSYWVSRMKPEENLFYSSAKEAVAQQRRIKHTQMAESTLELPWPEIRFRSSRALDSTLAFLPFYGSGSVGSRVVVADSGGGTLLYDADQGSAEILPPINEGHKWLTPISLCVTNPKQASRPDALYAINQANSASFKSLVYCSAADVMAWRWLDLPNPPYFSSANKDRTIMSHTLLGDGKTICFSGSGFGTYCFDTDTHEWTETGTWTLPFHGRAMQVPELYNLYFGFHESNPDNIVALELPSPLHVASPPKVLHQWRGFCPPHRNEWSLMESSLLYLGNYRFCIAKWFAIYHGSSYEGENLLDMAAVLTGVEIVDGLKNKDKLQMVKHKTRTFIFEDHNLETVL